MDKCKGIINDKVIAMDINVANSFYKRLIGLLTHKKLEDGEGLLISSCKQVHTFGMRFNIDLLFLSIDGQILHIEENVAKNKISKYIKNAVGVLELGAGVVKEFNILPGEVIRFEVL